MKEAPASRTRTLRLPFDSAGRAAIARALEEGHVMSYPTETSYALGGNALDPSLVEKVYRLKGRPAQKAILLLVDGARGLGDCAHKISPAAERLMETFWPGPLTLVFHAAPGLPAHLREGRGTVALRWSAHPAVAELLAIGGVPLIGTSANLGGRPAAHGLSQVLETFGNSIHLAVDGGATTGGPPSTLLDTTTLPFRILRQGPLDADALGRVLPEPYQPEASLPQPKAWLPQPEASLPRSEARGMQPQARPPSAGPAPETQPQSQPGPEPEPGVELTGKRTR